MREIKFRAWLNDKNMVYYDFLMTADVKRFAVDEWALSDLMQFTGLLDKNGKEIYEGDIMPVSNEFHIKGNAVVEFHNGEFDLIVGDGLWSKLSEVNEEYEIIGNIYENKELLKENCQK